MRLKNNFGHIIGLFLFLLLMIPGTGEARISIDGELGVDLDGQTQLKQETGVVSDTLSDTLQMVELTNSISRVLSNHFLIMTMTSPIVNDNFATLAGRAKIYGSYDVADATRGKKTSYHDPKLHTYSAGLSLFPNRPFPLALNFDKAFNRNVRSEENHRAKIEFLSPELNLVRKYENEVTSRGANWKMVFNEKVSLTTDYKQNKSTTLRIYDFGEASDIFIDTTQRFPDPTALSREVVFINSLTDDSVYVFLDNDLIPFVTLDPGETYITELENRSYFIEFIPQTKYNDWSAYYNINYFEKFEILPSEILSPDDLNQKLTSFSTNLKTESIKNFTSETRYDYSDSRESYQDIITFLGNFNNNMTYDFSRTSKLNMMTTFTDNKSKLDTLPTKINKSFLNQTIFGTGKRGGIVNTLTHTYTAMSTQDGPSKLTSTSNLFRNQTTLPLEKYHYLGDWKNTATLLKDNTGYTSNLYGTDYTSKFELTLGEISLVPKHQIKYSFGRQTEGDSAQTVSNTSEIQNKFNLDLTIPDFLFFGNIRAKGEIDLKLQDWSNKTIIRNRYLFDFTSTRRFGKKIKLLSFASVEKETTGGSNPVAGENADQLSSAREAIIRYLYKFDLQTSPFQNIQINTNFGKIMQAENVITRIGIAFIGDIPLLKLPIKSFLNSEKREVGTNAPAILTTLETKFDFRFRQISFIFSHLYTYESRGSLIYKDNEIKAKISRQFMVL